MTRNPKNGIFAAKQFGAEFQANPGSSRMQYLNDSAYCFGEDKEIFSHLSPEEKEACLKAFSEGVLAEKSLQ